MAPESGPRRTYISLYSQCAVLYLYIRERHEEFIAREFMPLLEFPIPILSTLDFLYSAKAVHYVARTFLNVRIRLFFDLVCFVFDFSIYMYRVGTWLKHYFLSVLVSDVFISHRWRLLAFASGIHAGYMISSSVALLDSCKCYCLYKYIYIYMQDAAFYTAVCTYLYFSQLHVKT